MVAPIASPQQTHHSIKTVNLSYNLSPSKFDQLLNLDAWQETANEKTRYILKNVNCEAKAGELTAIAGSSGAGKTSLLEILAGVIVRSRVIGHVLVNGQPLNVAHFRRASGYVTQDEALFPLLTVEETLMYSARLRLHGGSEAARERVRDLLQELGPDHVAAVRIGSESRRGISGGSTNTYPEILQNIFRTKDLYGARTIETLLAGILLGTIFMDTTPHSLN
ncbi:unnamed protein product [Coffea canephora]|uniref:ABC transporter domain-containing protein n=1 Tax=Coffea canephora TaxID=49390 RepID=A0A068VCK8_COFCA|nr:unnamed protein product [Coffea canephora]